MGSNRRMLIILMFSAFVTVAATPLSFVYAKDGDGSGGGSDGGGSGHGGGDDGGGDNHGGRDGSDNDHGTRGSGDGDRGEAGGSSGTRPGRADYERARDAVRDGQIMPLKSILQKIDVERYGRIIDIRLGRSQSQDIYQVKLRDGGGVIRNLKVDARTGAVLGRN
ncbi:PepSY domain-containing protein [Aliirhizobium smilacinae]|uniref:PepSY domain-containing protein n=1 Tax=Aliirhizobium smilacinae TaxID=1395944 RepID=A0A5C4XIU6_9HYPH|nr:hypothetical protein [Rhizobium smilacinae]TNM63383.1 hypothetical protein FHP24_11225 [Rhizobium smilacinae]